MRLNDELNVPIANGGLMSFQQLADGADRFEAMIDQLGGVQQPALDTKQP